MIALYETLNRILRFTNVRRLNGKYLLDAASDPKHVPFFLLPSISTIYFFSISLSQYYLFFIVLTYIL